MPPLRSMKARMRPLTSVWREGGWTLLDEVLGARLLPGKILPRKLQNDDDRDGEGAIRADTAGRSRRLSANAISTCRAIKRAVCRVASVVRRRAISHTPVPKSPKVIKTVAK